MTPPRRAPLIRVLALFWAVLQMASPAASAISDGLLASGNSAEQVAHVESATTNACPVVHAPDCAVCRYLSGSVGEAVQCGVLQLPDVGIALPDGQYQTTYASAVVLPPGRAPPTA